MNKYSVISEINFILEKKYANSIESALLVSDEYVTLSMAESIESMAIEREVSEKISNLK